jgi:chloramphenicol-sensitive protein RarD
VNERRIGVFASLGAYGLWGFMPLYIRMLAGLPPLEIVAHRAFWSCLLLSGVVAVQRRGGQVFHWLRDSRLVWRFSVSACLLALNWVLYVVAVGEHRVVDASLGYFINPLVSVMLGVFVLGERLRLGQWLCVGLAGAGVTWIAASTGQMPWIGLVLAASFGSYGLIRKTAALGAFDGLLLETLLVAPLAVLFLGSLAWTGESGFLASSWGMRCLLALSGVITAGPLLLFSVGARRVPLTQLGLLQYMSPTIQFSLGVFLWGEAFPVGKLVGFTIIWCALGLYAAEGLWVGARRAT